LQGAPSQQGRMYPQPSQRSCDVSQRIRVSQFGQGSVRSATAKGRSAGGLHHGDTADYPAYLIDEKPIDRGATDADLPRPGRRR
jgi:hypothetical protein